MIRYVDYWSTETVAVTVKSRRLLFFIYLFE
jgi:hypothetical protein